MVWAAMGGVVWGTSVAQLRVGLRLAESIRRRARLWVCPSWLARAEG
jgi:hypothetical protein